MRQLNLVAAMKNTSRKALAAAAMVGLFSGAAIRQSYADGANITTATNGVTATNIAPGKVARKKPKVHDCSGLNECKGLGGCKTAEHECKFKNACKGKGGCELTKKDIQDWEKAQKEKEAKHPSS
jgi:hypothetical protein